MKDGACFFFDLGVADGEKTTVEIFFDIDACDVVRVVGGRDEVPSDWLITMPSAMDVDDTVSN